MSTRKISWEIVLAGLTFIGIGIYLSSQSTASDKNTASAVSHADSHAPEAPSPSTLPGAIVIDLQNLENLKNLKNLESLKKLKIDFENIDKVIEKHKQEGQIQESIEQSLQKLETELQKIEQADFNVKLQDQKVYINKNYNVEQAQWTEVSPGVYIFRESFPIDKLQSLNIDLSFGNVNIIGNNTGKGEITLRATGNVEDPARFSDNLNIQKNLTSAAAFKILSSENADISNKINLEATLTLPENIAIQAKTSGGHINAHNLTNNQRFHTSGGHISLVNMKGKTIAKTGGGHITGDQIVGNTTLTTGGGHIRVTTATGSLAVKTGGGHIEIEEATGSVNAQTSGGNISAAMRNVTGPLKFTTSAGNISLLLPADLAANLDISGSSVHLTDVFEFNGTKNKGRINGTINGGGIPILIKCEYGNVNINAKK